MSHIKLIKDCDRVVSFHKNAMTGNDSQVNACQWHLGRMSTTFDKDNEFRRSNFEFLLFISHCSRHNLENLFSVQTSVAEIKKIYLRYQTIILILEIANGCRKVVQK